MVRTDRHSQKLQTFFGGSTQAANATHGLCADQGDAKRRRQADSNQPSQSDVAKRSKLGLSDDENVSKSETPMKSEAVAKLLEDVKTCRHEGGRASCSCLLVQRNG